MFLTHMLVWANKLLVLERETCYFKKKKQRDVLVYQDRICVLKFC